ncbi:MAG: hypothetical protein QXO37_06905 [Candidatus Nitrosocaldaceae archaeon]
MHSLTIRYKDNTTKYLFDLARSKSQLTSEDILRLLCKAYLFDSSTVNELGEKYNGWIKIDEKLQGEILT